MLAQNGLRDDRKRSDGAIMVPGRREDEFDVVGVDVGSPVQVGECLGHHAGVELSVNSKLLHLIHMEGEIPKTEGLKFGRLLAFGTAPSP